jgi:hypothetical protein
MRSLEKMSAGPDRVPADLISRPWGEGSGFSFARHDDYTRGGASGGRWAVRRRRSEQRAHLLMQALELLMDLRHLLQLGRRQDRPNL